MKTKIVAAAAIMLVTISLQCMSQPPAPRDGRYGPPRGPRQQQLQQVVVYTGQVGEWVTNDDYVYDGFYLQTAQEKLPVKFPPHLGTQLTTAVKKGSNITINGTAEVNPWGEKEIRMVSITANGQTIYDTPPATPLSPPVETLMTGSGKITALQKNREGMVNGYILDNKTIIRVPPHIAMQLSQIAVAGSDVSFTGMKKTTQNGEATTGNYTIVHAQTITVNGTQYLTR